MMVKERPRLVTMTFNPIKWVRFKPNVAVESINPGVPVRLIKTRHSSIRRSELNIENLLVLRGSDLTARGRRTYGPTTMCIMIPPNHLVDWFNHN